jgi:hypothetical protein
MTFLLDIAIVLISLVFLGIVGLIAGVAIPGLFMSAAAPWLDWILPIKRTSTDETPTVGPRSPAQGPRR